MPFFVVRRAVSGAGPPAPGTADQSVVMLSQAGHATREEAEREREAWREREPGAEIGVVEAPSAMEVMARGQTADGGVPALRVEPVRTWDAMQSALWVRRRVFIEEQGVSLEEEIDEQDLPRAWGRTAVHVLGRLAATQLPVATGRLLLDYPEGEHAHIGRVAVLREFRGAGYGRAVMEALHEEARRRGRPGITLAAQVTAIPFYERLGYVARGEVFLDAGIEHRWMDVGL